MRDGSDDSTKGGSVEDILQPMKVLAVLAVTQLYRAFRACCAVWDAMQNSD